MGTNLRQRSDGGLDLVSDATGNIVNSFGVGGNAISASSSLPNLTAHAGGGQNGALPLTSRINQVTTVASANDSVALPVSAAGISVIVINAAATNSLQVFGVSPDTINTAATGTGIALAAGKSAEFYCPIAGKWYMNLSA